MDSHKAIFIKQNLISNTTYSMVHFTLILLTLINNNNNTFYLLRAFTSAQRRLQQVKIQSKNNTEKQHTYLHIKSQFKKVGF